MGQKELYPWQRRLLLCLGADVKRNSGRYREAGRWLDSFHDLDQFWQRRQWELDNLRRKTAAMDASLNQFKIDYLELMLELRIYVPFDSFEFWLMVHDRPHGDSKTNDPAFEKVCEKLRATRDLSDEDFGKWAYDHAPLYKESGLSMGAFTFAMQIVLTEQMRTDRLPPIGELRERLSRMREMLREPPLCYRFKDAQHNLFWRCWTKDFLSVEDATRVAVTMWILTDPTTTDSPRRITKFEAWSWDQGTVARSNAYYETLLLDPQTGGKWINMATNACEVLSLADESDGASKASQRRSAEGDTDDAPRSRSSKRFAIALSFPGERRDFVEQVASYLAGQVGQERVLYDKYHEAEFARPDLDVYLPNLYSTESKLIVIFLCADYAKKRWCKLEWRDIRQLISTSESRRIMFVSFDEIGAVPELGILSGDGYLSVGSRSPDEIGTLILRRLELNRQNEDQA